jgi:hypothetical protein
MGIGMGIVAYAVAVVIYTLLSVWRSRRRRRYHAVEIQRESEISR